MYNETSISADTKCEEQEFAQAQHFSSHGHNLLCHYNNHYLVMKHSIYDFICNNIGRYCHEQKRICIMCIVVDLSNLFKLLILIIKD